MVTFEDWERQRVDRAIGVVATTGPGGAPHAAPVQVWFEGADLRFETDRSSRKYRNLVRDPRVAICVYGQPKWGVVISGTAETLPGEDQQAQIRVTPTAKSSWRRKEG